MMRGTWQTDSSGPSAGPVVALVVAVVAAVLACDAAAGAAFALGEILAVAGVAVAGVAAGAGVALAAMRRRGRRRARPPAEPAALWRVNPQAVPPRPRAALPSPPVIVNVNLDPAILAGLTREPAPAVRVIEPGTEEQSHP